MDNNVFRNMLADMVFKLDVVEKVFEDYKEWTKKPLTKDSAYDALMEYFETFELEIEEFLEDEFGEAERTNED